MTLDRNHQPDTADTHTESMVRLARLWSSAMPSVEAFISASVRDPHDRDDLIQQTSEYLARNFHKYEAGTSFVAWAISVARFRMLELWRDRSREKLLLTGDAIESVAEAAIQLQPEISEREEALAQCMQQLGGEQRRMLEMRYSHGLKPAMIAERVGKSANAVSAALFRLRMALRRCIEKHLADSAEPRGDMA